MGHRPRPRRRAADERTAFIEAGMQAYEKGLKKQLLWLIYVIPTIGFMTTIYFVNWH
jgi:hypothetical protein